MAGILKVDKYQDFNGNDIMTSDGAGNITINNAALKNTPAFSAYFSASGNPLTQNVATLVSYNTEYFDTDSAYDTSTGKFTVPTGKAGKYFFTATVSMATNFAYIQVYIYKNGLSVARGDAVRNDSSTGGVYTLLDLSVGDYIQVYCIQDAATQNVVGGGSSLFNGYKLIGA